VRALRARACAFAFWVFVVRWRRVGAPAGGESDGGESDDELGGGAYSTLMTVLQSKSPSLPRSLEQGAEATPGIQEVMVMCSYCGGTKRQL